MILVDTSAIYALLIRRDDNHSVAKHWYAEHASKDGLVITQLVICECWFLVKSRYGYDDADLVWESAIRGAFAILDLDATDIGAALAIRKKYGDSKMSFVDATSLAACERHKIDKVFTFDHKLFGMYRPGFSDHLMIVPGSASSANWRVTLP